MIKGHTKIELTDVSTGEVNTYEDTNMVTKAFYDMCQHNGVGGINVFNLFCNKGSDLLSAMTKGLLLYDTEIVEDETKYFAPGNGTRLVGCGADIVYIGSQLAAGSYNSVESGAIENGYKHVWDFGTSQANGHIACACLTTAVGGFITTGTEKYALDWSGNGRRLRQDFSTSSTGSATFLYPMPADCSDDGLGALASSQCCLAINANKNEMLCVKNYYSLFSPRDLTYTDYRGANNIFKTKELVLRRYRLPLTKISIFEKVAHDSPPQLIEDDIVIPMPEQLQNLINPNFLGNSSYRFWSFVTRTEDYTYITLVFSSGLSTESSHLRILPNSKFYVWEINNDTLESNVTEVTNTTGVSLAIYGSQDTRISPFVVTKEKVFVVGMDGEIFMIDKNDNTIVTPIMNVYGHDNIGHEMYLNSVGFVSPFIENNKLYFYKRFYTSDSDFVKHMYTIDMSTGFCASINCTWALSPSGNGRVSMLDGNSGTMIKVKGKRNLYFTDNGNIALQVMIPFVHMTINNLETAVDKTASQTMKVTYTITEV